MLHHATVALIVVILVVAWLLLNRSHSSLNFGVHSPLLGSKAQPVVTIGG